MNRVHLHDIFDPAFNRIILDVALFMPAGYYACGSAQSGLAKSDANMEYGRDFLYDPGRPTPLGLPPLQSIDVIMRSV